MINDELKANGFQTDGGGKGAKLDNKGAMNENSDELLYRLMPSISGESGGGGGGPQSPMAGEKSSTAEGTDMGATRACPGRLLQGFMKTVKTSTITEESSRTIPTAASRLPQSST